MLDYEKIANGILMATTFISTLININIIIMHIKQSLLKDGFFNVVFYQIITEFLINMSIFFHNLFYLIYEGTYVGKWFIIFPILFNFAYEANIVYNIRIIFFLMTYNKDKEEMVNYEKDNDVSILSDLSKQKSLSFIGISFKSFHFLAFGIATIYIILYICNLLFFQDDITIQEEGWAWYYYFFCGKNKYWQFFFFTFHIIFFIISVIYFFKSCDKNKISNHIFLKSYSLYCLFSSLISLFVPVSLLVFIIINSDEKHTKVKDGFLITLLIGFLLFLIVTSIFRLKNYYVNYILTQDGKGFLNWLKNFFGILFCVKTMKELNFVDLNSTFIYHALSSNNDLIIEGVPDSELIASSQTELVTQQN